MANREAWALFVVALSLSTPFVALAANPSLSVDNDTHYLYDVIIAIAFVAITALALRNRKHRAELLLRDRRLKRLLELSWRLEQARDYGAILGAASDAIRGEIGFNNRRLTVGM